MLGSDSVDDHRWFLMIVVSLFTLYFFLFFLSYVHIMISQSFFIIGYVTNTMLDSDVFTEDDWKLVQLVLTLFRNILAIQEISLQQKAGGTASQFLSRRDSFLELLFHENVMDLVLVITQHIGDHRSYLSHDNLLLLEIFHYIFIGQEPELIANAYSKGAKVGVLSSLSDIFLIEVYFLEASKENVNKNDVIIFFLS